MNNAHVMGLKHYQFCEVSANIESTWEEINVAWREYTQEVAMDNLFEEEHNWMNCPIYDATERLCEKCKRDQYADECDEKYDRLRGN